MSDIEDRLRHAIAELRLPFVDKIGKVSQNPLTGKMDYTVPDPYPPGATSRGLSAFERRTKIALPSDVKKWLIITSGAAGFFGVAPERETWSIERMWNRKPHWRKIGGSRSGPMALATSTFALAIMGCALSRELQPTPWHTSSHRIHSTSPTSQLTRRRDNHCRTTVDLT